QLSGSRIENSYSLCTVTSAGNYVGGIAGKLENSATVSYSYAASNISGNNYVGGLVGENYYSTIKNSVAANSGVTAALSGANAHRIVGNNSAGSGTFQNNYANKDMVFMLNEMPTSPAGGVTNNGTDKTLDDLKAEAFYTTPGNWNSGAWDFADVWEIEEGVSLPVFRQSTTPDITAPVYNPGDIAVINAIIDNNGLNWTKANPADGSYVPADWKNGFGQTGVFWSDDAENKRVTELDVQEKNLTGTLDVTGLTAMDVLRCNNNQLTALDVSGLTALGVLHCFGNQLTELDVSDLSSLRLLWCHYNQLAKLDLSNKTGSINYTGRDQSVALTLTGSGTSYTAAVTMNAGTTFGNNALSYANGKLTSSSSVATSSTFAGATGFTGTNSGGGNNNLSGTLTLTYETLTYGVSIATLSNGTVTLDKNTNPANYEAGETVTLTITPAESYELLTISAHKTGDEGTTVTLDGTGNSRTFTMPDFGVTVTATFGITITTGINEIHNNTPARITGYFNILGQKLPQEPQSGVYIIMYDNGKTDKRIK
ncbi:MAG: hypothetical protein LBN27_02735, partial [Prevotellaceae bacterium]|nr:hypothetical protein [Prevotellaceae bacterium]